MENWYYHPSIWLAAMCITAYLLGSIPSSVWIGKRFYGKDVRDYGSGNAGATNTFRVLGKTAGSVVLVMDILKGYFATSIVYFGHFNPHWHYGNYQHVNIMLGLGICAVIGHLIPVFAQFKGGKGIATLGGLLFALNYQVACIALGIFLITLFVTRFVSLGSILAGISIPMLFVRFFGAQMPEYRQPSVVIFTVLIAVLVVYTHRKNIIRLIQGNENKAKLLPKHRRIQ
jgi:glycerol-3-phosphate acyltransferase PlsY